MSLESYPNDIKYHRTLNRMFRVVTYLLEMGPTNITHCGNVVSHIITCLFYFFCYLILESTLETQISLCECTWDEFIINIWRSTQRCHVSLLHKNNTIMNALETPILRTFKTLYNTQKLCKWITILWLLWTQTTRP